MSSREEKLDYPWARCVKGVWLAGESEGCKNDCEDTANNIGDDSAS